jgi:hypothetical protein
VIAQAVLIIPQAVAGLVVAVTLAAVVPVAASTDPLTKVPLPKAYYVSKQLLDVLNELQLDYVIDDGKVFLRTREFFPRHEEFSELVREIVDRIYTRGFQDGFQRGAYETETKEDV